MSILAAVLFILLCIALFFLGRFVRIIMIFEDDLSEATNKLNDVEEALDAILGMQLFFDTPEVRGVVLNAMETVRLAKFSVNQIAKKFVQRSKQKYIRIIEEEPPPGESHVAGGFQEQQQIQAGIAAQMGPLPGEGTIAHVTRPQQQTPPTGRQG